MALPERDKETNIVYCAIVAELLLLLLQPMSVIEIFFVGRA